MYRYIYITWPKNRSLDFWAIRNVGSSNPRFSFAAEEPLQSSLTMIPAIPYLPKNTATEYRWNLWTQKQVFLVPNVVISIAHIWKLRSAISSSPILGIRMQLVAFVQPPTSSSMFNFIQKKKTRPFQQQTNAWPATQEALFKISEVF